MPLATISKLLLQLGFGLGCWLLWVRFAEAKGGTLKIEKAFKSGPRNFLRESHNLSFFMAQKGLAEIFTPEGFKKDMV